MPQSLSDPRQVMHTHMPLFTKHSELVPANGSDVMKLAGNSGLGRNYWQPTAVFMINVICMLSA